MLSNGRVLIKLPYFFLLSFQFSFLFIYFFGCDLFAFFYVWWFLQSHHWRAHFNPAVTLWDLKISLKIMTTWIFAESFNLHFALLLWVYNGKIRINQNSFTRQTRKKKILSASFASQNLSGSEYSKVTNWLPFEIICACKRCGPTCLAFVSDRVGLAREMFDYARIEDLACNLCM